MTDNLTILVMSVKFVKLTFFLNKTNIINWHFRCQNVDDSSSKPETTNIDLEEGEISSEDDEDTHSNKSTTDRSNNVALLSQEIKKTKEPQTMSNELIFYHISYLNSPNQNKKEIHEATKFFLFKSGQLFQEYLFSRKSSTLRKCLLKPF